jgi:hypothetical protein
MQWGQGRRGMAATQARHAFDEEAIRILSGGDVNLFHLRGTFRCSSNTELISNGGPNGIRAVVGLDLIFSIRGVAIRQQGDELGPTPPLA